MNLILLIFQCVLGNIFWSNQNLSGDENIVGIQQKTAMFVLIIYAKHLKAFLCESDDYIGEVDTIRSIENSQGLGVFTNTAFVVFFPTKIGFVVAKFFFFRVWSEKKLKYLKFWWNHRYTLQRFILKNEWKTRHRNRFGNFVCKLFNYCFLISKGDQL